MSVLRQVTRSFFAVLAVLGLSLVGACSGGGSAKADFIGTWILTGGDIGGGVITPGDVAAM